MAWKRSDHARSSRVISHIPTSTLSTQSLFIRRYCQFPIQTLILHALPSVIIQTLLRKSPASVHTYTRQTAANAPCLPTATLPLPLQCPASSPQGPHLHTRSRRSTSLHETAMTCTRLSAPYAPPPPPAPRERRHHLGR